RVRREHDDAHQRVARRFRRRSAPAVRVEESKIGPPVPEAALGAVHDLPRLHEISLVFIRHGLGDLVRRIGVSSILERAGAMLHWGEAARSAQLEPQQRLRLAFEELGPTFIKLGQMLSMREDLLPPKWTEELA